MALTELNSFIFKFNQLWHSGISAHLDIDTHAGEAWVGLRVHLGHAPPQEAFYSQSNFPRSRDGPSRQRRRARRAEKRDEVHVEKPVTEAEEAVAPMDDKTQNVEEEVAEKATVEEQINVSDEQIGDSTEVAAVEAEEDTVEDVEAEVETTEEQVENTVSVVKDAKKVETVYATAEFENSPYNTLMEDDLKSLEKYLFSEKHLQDNIENYEFECVSNSQVNLKINVKIERLWETARQYLWKHIGGTNYWDRQNGTRIRIKRIHVK